MNFNLAAVFLIIVGTLQMVGDLFHLPLIKTLGLVSHSSPAPKVFTAQEGFETYSSNFYIKWQGTDNREHTLHLTPSIYKNIRGPYNRRNAYGAALSYAPVLYANPRTRDMQTSVMQYAFCGNASLSHELGINPTHVATNIKIEIVPRQTLPKNHQWKLNYEIICNQ